MLTNNVKIKNFFLGKWYPALNFALIVLGYISGLEVYTILLSAILMAIAIVKTCSIKPMVFYILTFMYQFNSRHLPMKPYNSEHYYTGINLIILLLAALIIVASVLIYLGKSRILSYVSWRSIPLILPLTLFSAAMLLNGVLTPGDDLMNFVWGAGQVLVYFVIYVLLYLGLRRENREELLQYFHHVVTLMSWVIIVEVVWFYLTSGMSFVEFIQSRSMSLGISSCNIVGAHAAMLIPANLHAFLKGKRPYLSLLTTMLVYAVALASTSRNAMLFGSVYLVLCIAICIFSGARGRQMGKIVLVSVVFLAVFGLIFRSQIESIIELYLNRGMGNNGRYPLWEKAFYEFLQSPIFGKGFYTIDLTTPNSFEMLSFDLVPDFAHNTVFELLGATGIVGFVTYFIYRISTLILTFKRPTLDRLMLMITASYIVLSSLLDNFVFQIFSPVLYTVAVAFAALVYEDDMKRPCTKRKG